MTMGLLSKLLAFLLLLQFCNGQDARKHCYINGKKYECGQGDFFKNCMDFECHCDGKWWTSGQYRLRRCKECTLYNDPHITTFDGARYDWHGECTYVLAEEEDGSSYVHGKFTKCSPNSRASCVDVVTFKPRGGPVIEIRKSNTYLTYGYPYDADVVINGFSQRITTPETQMQVLKGPKNIEHHVLAYYLDRCLHIIAAHEQDFLVKVCRSSVRIFSTRKIHSKKNVAGMCGSPDDGTADDDLRLRNGKVVENPNGCCFNHIVDAIFANDWQVSYKPCDGVSGRRKRSIDEESGKKLCEASENQKAEYYRVCRDLIGKDRSLSEEKKKEFIDTCAFDQCIVTQTGANADTAKEWLNQYTGLIEQEKFKQEHQDDMSDEDYEYIDYLDDYYDELDSNEITTPAPPVCQGSSKFNWLNVGSDCFIRFDQKLNWTDARKLCESHGLDLYIPKNATEVAKYLSEHYSNGGYMYHWMGARGNGTHMVWVSGNVLSKDAPMIPSIFSNAVTTDACLWIVTNTESRQPAKGVLITQSPSCYRKGDFYTVCG